MIIVTAILSSLINKYIGSNTQVGYKYKHTARSIEIVPFLVDGIPFWLMSSRGGPPLGGCMLMSSRGGPPI